MGTYSTEEWRELFGGDPEPGEAYLPLHAADHVRKSARENGHHCHRALNTPADPDPACTNCGAPAGEPCQHWCHWEAIS